MTRCSPPCSAFWKKRSSASPSSRMIASSGSVRAPTSCALAAGSSSTNAPRRGGGPGSALRLPHEQDDLAELAALLEALVGGGRLLERERLVDEDPYRATLEERHHMRFRLSGDKRLLFQRPVAERRTRDRRPLLHDA